MHPFILHCLTQNSLLFHRLKIPGWLFLVIYGCSYTENQKLMGLLEPGETFPPKYASEFYGTVWTIIQNTHTQFTLYIYLKIYIVRISQGDKIACSELADNWISYVHRRH